MQSRPVLTSALLHRVVTEPAQELWLQVNEFAGFHRKPNWRLNFYVYHSSNPRKGGGTYF